MTASVRPAKDTADVCAEAGKLLRAGEVAKATSLYMSAFLTNATSAIAHMRTLDTFKQEEVIFILESWLDNHEENQPGKSFNKGIVAVFLSTLNPCNLSATVFKMESLLLNGGHGCEEICARCTDLLQGKRNPPPEGSIRTLLEITRALAHFLWQTESSEGLRFYLKAYLQNKTETMTLMRTRQGVHLPQIVEAFKEQIVLTHPSLAFNDEWMETKRKRDKLNIEDISMLFEFLLAISPGEREVQELQAGHLFLIGRFSESAEMYSSLLQEGQCRKGGDKVTYPERRARLLTCRAAACLSAGGKAAEECKALAEAFQIHANTAQIYFQKLFTNHGKGMASRNHLRQQAEKGMSDFRDKVLIREDLRSTEGAELLDPAIASLRTLCHLEPDGGGRELRVRLADCLLLRGRHQDALSICNTLVATLEKQSYPNTVQVHRGYARLHCDDHKGAGEDFQTVIEHTAPHPSSCVRALCGRGLLRMLAGSNYLAALDYVTASRLHPQETALTVRCLVPWNYRGLLLTVLLEQGRTMLEETVKHKPMSHLAEDTQHPQDGGKLQPSSNKDNQSGTPTGVHSLAVLLMELQPGDDGPRTLAADALYQLSRVEEAYRLILSIGTVNPRAPILARLALLQLHRGFLYDTNQLLKKLIVCSDTSCLRSLLAMAHAKDRTQLQAHCHSTAKRILDCTREERALREAVTYLSIAIMASAGEAVDSLLERGRCYALLGQRNTAIFDFSAILKRNPKHVHALCGRGFIYLMLDRQKDCIQDIVEALEVDADIIVTDILSLKEKAQKLVSDWLHQWCWTSLSDTLKLYSVPCHEEQLKKAFLIAVTLMKINSREPKWHLLYVDVLLAKADVQTAAAHLSLIFGREPRDAAAGARLGVVEVWQQSHHRAAVRFSKLIKKDSASLDILLALIPFNQQKCLAQAASREASVAASEGHWGQATSLLTVAVHVKGDHTLECLRQRAACFAHLGLHDQAITDLDKVIQKHCRSDPGSPEDYMNWAEDLCQRGSSQLRCSREEAALRDFIHALELHRDQTLQSGAVAGVGRQHLTECFHRAALRHYGEQQLDDCWTMIECGLLFDGENDELRRLKAQVKREVASPCNIN